MLQSSRIRQDLNGRGSHLQHGSRHAVDRAPTPESVSSPEVRVSPDHHPAIVGSPSYFESHPQPTSPRDLLAHRCVNFRHGADGVYRWEFDRLDESLTVAVNGPLITNDIGLLIRAALDGVGLAFVSAEHAAPQLASGALIRVLEEWCPPFAGFFLYYPSRRQQPAGLAALIETLRVQA